MIEQILHNTRDDMLQTLEEIVNIDSGSHDKEGVDRIGQFFKTKYESLGFVTQTFTSEQYGNTLVFQHERATNPRLLIVGHMDTVFEKGTAKRRPFTVDGQYAYGPGVIDMKASLVMLYYSIAYLLKHAPDAAYNVQIILNSDEEIGSPSSKAVIEQFSENKDCALVLEPARKDGSIVSSRRGGGTYYVDVIGKAAHSGIEPDKGRNAIKELAHKVIAFENLSEPQNGLHVNVVQAEGGVASNVIAPNAKAVLDIRTSLLEQGPQVVRDIRSICQTPNIPNTEIVVTGSIDRPPMPFTERTERFVTFVQKEAEKIGISLRHTSTGGGSDASFPAALGIPTLDGMGPIGGGQHSEREYLVIPSLVERTHLFIRVLDRLATVPDRYFY